MSTVPWYVLSVIREACALPEEQRTEEQIETCPLIQLIAPAEWA